MSGPPSGNSGAAKWILSLLAVPVIYVATEPLIVWGAMYHARATGAELPEWKNSYAVPYQWVKLNTPLQGVLSTYDCWCFGKVTQLLNPRVPGQPLPADPFAPAVAK